MTLCFFATDLHGRIDRYDRLFAAIEDEKPSLVFLGGDLMPNRPHRGEHDDDFLRDVIAANLTRLRNAMGQAYPHIFAILGNDDPRREEDELRKLDEGGLLHYAHNRRSEIGDLVVLGYSFVPPTPFLNKDWEKYDVSRYVPPGSVSPEEGFRSVSVDRREIRFATIARDLEALGSGTDFSRAILLVHTPPHDTHLDRVGTDGLMIDHVPLDRHVGSIALRRFIESREPMLTLHGHIHESARLTGRWRDRIGRTHLFSAAHDGHELCLIRFDPNDLDAAERILL